MLDLFNVLFNTCKGESTACGVQLGTGLPGNIVNIVHYVYIGIQIIVPLLLIIFGMIDLAKAITAQKEDEIQKAQKGLMKKAIVAVIVFLIFSLVQFIVNFAAGDESKGIISCLNEILNEGCSAG